MHDSDTSEEFKAPGDEPYRSWTKEEEDTLGSDSNVDLDDIPICSQEASMDFLHQDNGTN